MADSETVVPYEKKQSILPFISQAIKNVSTSQVNVLAVIEKLNGFVPNRSFSDFLIESEASRKPESDAIFLNSDIEGGSHLFTEIYEFIEYFTKHLTGIEKELFNTHIFKVAAKEWGKTDAAKEWAEKQGGASKAEISLPNAGKLISEFALECANEIKDTNTLFYRIDSREIVEIGKIKLQKDGDEVYTGFVSVTPNRFITLVEKYLTPGLSEYNRATEGFEFRKKSMSSYVAGTVLASEMFQQAMPQINRIFTVPIPIMYEGNLTFPKEGYDERFYSWLPSNSPKINTTMPLKDAKDIILSIYKEFCFQSKQDYTNAVAGLLTPFIRGLMPSFCTRTPVYGYLANRERAGKDYLAGITGIVYEGDALEEAPISTSENAKSNNTDELRKKFLSSLIGGRKRMHFSNNKGFINNAVFESIITAEKYSDRVLGKSEIMTFENEIDFSWSGNCGIGFTPDFANRCRFIRMFLDIEDANARVFENPNLHNWVRANRGLILSALYTLVRNWHEQGMPEGKVPFSSFPAWARVCGGIMEAAGYESPCAPDKEVMALGGDSETQDMKQLFEICYAKYPEQWLHKNEIRDLVISDESNLFGYLDFQKKSDQTKFGNKITKFIGRVLSDIRLVVKDASIRSARQEFMFTKEKKENNIFDGNLGNLGNLNHTLTTFQRKRIEDIEQVANVTKVAIETTPDTSTFDVRNLRESILENIRTYDVAGMADKALVLNEVISSSGVTKEQVEEQADALLAEGTIAKVDEGHWRIV